MAKSLNPHAAGQSAPAAPPPPTQRRSILVALAAATIGAVASLFPLGAGALVLLDPIFKRKKTGGEGQSDKRPFRRVASADALPADGTPVQVPVIADLTDAWNREANQPIGAVYLRKLSDGNVACFNAICPHAGCFVGYAADRQVFQCPCHTSSFELDGKRIGQSPSPRDMDALEVDAEKLKSGEVWVQFVNYYPGHEEREAKP